MLLLVIIVVIVHVVVVVVAALAFLDKSTCGERHNTVFVLLLNVRVHTKDIKRGIDVEAPTQQRTKRE